MSDFSETVKALVSNIPVGETRTYRQIAEAAKNPRAARAVANLMSKNYNPEIPCHRVIRSDGSLGGYNRGGTAAKKALLVSEGAIV